MIQQAKLPATQAFLELKARKQAKVSEEHHRLQSTSSISRRELDLSSMFDRLVDDRSSDHDRHFRHPQVNGSNNSSLSNPTPLTNARNHHHLRHRSCCSSSIESSLFPRIAWSSSSNESIEAIASPSSCSTKLTSTKLSSSPTTFWGDGARCGGKLLTMASWKNANKRKRNKFGLVRSQKIFCLTEINEEARVVSSDEEENEEDPYMSFYPSKRSKHAVAIGTTSPIVPLSKSSSCTNKTTTQSIQQSLFKSAFYDDCPFPICLPSPVYNNNGRTSSSS